VSKYEYIDSHKSEPANRNSVVKMCLWLAVSTSGFYHWATRPQSATAARRQALIARIQHSFMDVATLATVLQRARWQLPVNRGARLGARDAPRERGDPAVQAYGTRGIRHLGVTRSRLDARITASRFTLAGHGKGDIAFGLST
jgi:hypothetical protein